jgi:hypothetical protein
MNMARRHDHEAREVLTMKSQAVERYVSYYDQLLRQLAIDISKAKDLLRYQDFRRFSRRVETLVDYVFQAGPSTSPFQTDLIEAQGEFESPQDASSDWAWLDEHLGKLGISVDSNENSPDSILLIIRSCLNRRIDLLRDWEASPADHVGEMLESIDILDKLRVVLGGALHPARQVRNQLIDELNRQFALPPKRSPPPARRGRPKDPDIAKRNQKIAEAWGTGRYLTMAELAQEFRVSYDLVRKAIGQFPDLAKRKRSTEKPVK